MRFPVNKEKGFFFGLIVLVVMFFSMTASAAAPKVRLRSQITPDCGVVSNLKFADIYADGNIAVQGSYNCRGAFIYDISNPDAPVLASWYNPGNNQQFLEAIVVGNRAYFGSGTGGGGVHIVDVSNPYSPVFLGSVTTTNGNGFNNIHEMVVFGNYLIENFNSLSGNKLLKVINISNPAAPVFVRDINPTEVQWVHAIHIRGNRMFTSGWGNGSNRGRTEIYDITNIGTQAPTLLGFISDPTSITAGNSMHSSWSSEDGNYLYSCRETSNGSGDVRVYDIHDPAAPVLVNSLGMNALGLNAVTPHNPVVMGNYLYVAWYQAGLQVFDISSPANPVRVGQYDTFQPTFAPESQAGKQARVETEDPWDVICATPNRQNALPTSYDGNWAVFPFLGQNKILTGDLKYGLQILDATPVAAPAKNLVSDFDGDGKTDLSVYNQTTGDWAIKPSSTNVSTPTHWGASGDMMEPGDYDGDGKSDIAIFRPSSGDWHILGSSSGYRAFHFGANGDVPVAADYDADGKTDVAVWRPSDGVWYIQQSTLGFFAYRWGSNGDRAFSGDYEGDGKADLIIWRPASGYWYIIQSSSSIPLYIPFGLSNVDKPLTGDFDGDGKTDLAVYRPTTGFWYIQNSTNGQLSAYRFGTAEDIPIPADYDGDSKADVTVFRPSENAWYRLNSTNGAFVADFYGQSGDRPSPSSVQPQ